MLRYQAIAFGLFSGLMSLTLITGCGSSDSGSTSNNTSPPQDGSTGPSNREDSWVSIRLEDSRDRDACNRPTIVEVTPDGAYVIENCEVSERGELTGEQLAEIDTFADAIIENGNFDEPSLCMELAYLGNRYLDLTLNEERDVRLHDMSRRGSCFRGDVRQITALETQLFALIPDED